MTWGPKAGRAPEKRATARRVLLDNCDVDAVPVNDTLWTAALRMTENWRVGDLEEIRAQLWAEKMGEPLGSELGGQSAIAAEMPFDDAAMDKCALAEQTGDQRPVAHPVWGRMMNQIAWQSTNDNGRHANNSARDMAPSDPANDKALLQCLQGDLWHLASIVEQVVGALRTMQTSIDVDKCTAIASATVHQEAKVASTLSNAQAMLAGLGA